jgi:hypothetical protein
MDKLWYIHTREYSPVIKDNEILIHIRTYLNLKNIMLSERRFNSLKNICLYLYDIYGKGKIKGRENEWVVARS